MNRFDFCDFEMQCETRTALGRRWLWPRLDQHGFDYPLKYNVPDIEEHVRQILREKRRVAVQAGGCCGMIPWLLSLYYEKVYTFEPDPLNFYCLVNNTQGGNIFAFNAALGSFTAQVGLKHAPPQNIGMHKIEGHGWIPQLYLDGFPFRYLDGLFLDAEESEESIILGGINTISSHEPDLIMAETVSEHIRLTLEEEGFEKPTQRSKDCDWAFVRKKA